VSVVIPAPPAYGTIVRPRAEIQKGSKVTASAFGLRRLPEGYRRSGFATWVCIAVAAVGAPVSACIFVGGRAGLRSPDIDRRQEEGDPAWESPPLLSLRSRATDHDEARPRARRDVDVLSPTEPSMRTFALRSKRNAS
jgi:hypothetical protein